MRWYARRFDTAEAVCLDVAHGRIERIDPADAEPGATAAWPWVAPGLVDIQVNGYGGQEFSSDQLAAEDVERIVRHLDAFGVVRSLATVTTHSPAVMLHAVRTIAAACEASGEVARRLAGIHVEGPFLSPEDGPRGAHPVVHVRPPDLEEFRRLQDAAGGRIRILTLSPEYENAASFISEVARSGVVVAIGHTAARAEQIRAAVDAGARMSTHLGNGAHARIPRHHGYLWAQLADDRLLASLIADGHHLPADVLKTFVRAKGAKRCILISDLSGLAGLPPGVHESELCKLEILPNGKLVVAGQDEVLAGASAPLGACVANVIDAAGVSLAEAVNMATVQPAALLGIEGYGLAPGAAADLVFFRLANAAGDVPTRRFEPVATLLAGDVVWGSLPE